MAQQTKGQGRQGASRALLRKALFFCWMLVLVMVLLTGAQHIRQDSALAGWHVLQS